MLIYVFNGGLWGDFPTICWIMECLQQPINVWNKDNGWLMIKVGSQNTHKTYNIVYGNNHFEPCQYLLSSCKCIK
jgi:hypothetical protein